MTRTHKAHRDSRSGNGKGAMNAKQRQSNISRTLSKVLRHQAENERIPITKDGWVKVSDLLAWRGLSDSSKFNPQVRIREIMEVVEEDGITGKGRFGLKLSHNEKSSTASSGSGMIEVDGAATGDILEATQSLTLDQSSQIEVDRDGPDAELDEKRHDSIHDQTTTTTTTSSKNSHETLAVISYQSQNPNEPASKYLIRATQGHSIKTIESDGLLTQITLDDPSSIPDTVVHGTFYASWKSILSTGGLKSMSRNMVHFATGPTLAEMLPSDIPSTPTANDTDPTTLKTKQEVDTILSRNKVISGMRWDAQILIYIDIKRMLQDARHQGWDMKWFRSDNGVILTEGVIIPAENNQPDPQFAPDSTTQTSSIGLEGDEANRMISTPEEKTAAHQVKNKDSLPRKQMQTQTQTQTQTQKQTGSDAQKIVPFSYFLAAVEIKAGIGVLWRAGEGIIKDLPEHLSSKSLPRGKGPRGGDRQNKPRVRVERDTNLNVEDENE